MTALGGWRLGNTIDGVQAEYARIPFAQANLAVIPDSLSDEDVLLLADIASTGLLGGRKRTNSIRRYCCGLCTGAYRLVCDSGSEANGGVADFRRRCRCWSASHV